MTSIPNQSSSSTAPILPQQDSHDAKIPQYRQYPAVNPPSPVRLNYTKRLSETQRTERTRVQSSVSSAESGSTAGLNQLLSPQAYWHGSNAEQGVINEKMRSSWKQSAYTHSTHSPPRQKMIENNSAVLRYIQEQQKIEDDQKEDDHAVWILFWLSCLDPIHSFISAIYSILVVFTLVLAYPIRLCKSQPSFGDQLIRILAPIFRNHLDQLCAPSVEDAYDFDFRPLKLVLIHLSSPFVSIGVMLAAWVAAAFWLFAIIMGNPDGTEKGDDGRDAVLLVRTWWEKYLLGAIKR